jgi:hypothetical protein
VRAGACGCVRCVRVRAVRAGCGEWGVPGVRRMRAHLEAHLPPDEQIGAGRAHATQRGDGRGSGGGVDQAGPAGKVHHLCRRGIVQEKCM